METHLLCFYSHFQTPQLHRLPQKKPQWWQQCLRFRSSNTQEGKRCEAIIVQKAFHASLSFYCLSSHT